MVEVVHIDRLPLDADLGEPEGIILSGHFTEQDSVTLMKKGDTLVLPDVLTARFETFEDVGAAYRYLLTLRDDPVQALVSACARRGPWNMIAIAVTFGSPASVSLDEVFDTVKDATGVIVAGPEARAPAVFSEGSVVRAAGADRRSAAEAQPGPIVLAVEDSSHIQSMLRVGRYLGAALEGQKLQIAAPLVRYADVQEQQVHQVRLQFTFAEQLDDRDSQAFLVDLRHASSHGTGRHAADIRVVRDVAYKSQ